MPEMTIDLDGDNAWPDLKDQERRVIHLADETIIKVCALDGGMKSGKPSVCFRIDLPDGRVVLAETSARLFVMAAAAIVSRWPDVDDGAFRAHIERGKATIEVKTEDKS